MDFNRKDHIVVTIAETGEKRHLLTSRIKSVAPADPSHADGPAAIVYAQGEEGMETIRLIVAENVKAVVDDINGEPTPAERAQMEQDILRERRESYAARLRDLDAENERPDERTEQKRAALHDVQQDIKDRERQIDSYNNGVRRTWRGQLVEQLYLKEAAEKRARDPFSYHLYPDSTLLRFVGYGGLLRDVKIALDNQHKLDFGRGMQKAYFSEIERMQKDRAEQYQRDRENFLRLRDDPQMTHLDRARLEQQIREHRQSHGPAPEFRFQRDERTASYRPAQDISKEREAERLAHARHWADKIRERGNNQKRDDDPERERALRPSRGRDRGGPDYSR